MTRPNDREATIGFAKEQAIVDRDFQLFYTISTKDVGLNTLTHRPIAGQDGYFMLLVSPRAELSKTQEMPRDMVFVLDTSGSMRGKRMTQARNALKYCLENLTPERSLRPDELRHHGQQVHRSLLPATKDNLAAARKWVEALEATGGTAIDDALAAALGMRTNDETRPFTIVFFTDGQPTIGETNSEKILANVGKKNTANTRIFTFGVGDDVNATHARPPGREQPGDHHLRARNRGHRGQGDRPVRQDQQSGADQPEADGQRRRQAERGLSAAAARPVPRHPARRAGPLQRQGRQDARSR